MNNYEFSSERIITVADLMGNADKCRDKILNYAFNSPVMVKDYRQFFSLANMFKAVIFVVYCDPKDKNNRKKVLDSMVEARNQMPIDLQADKDGDYAIKKNKDVLFVMTSTPNLMFFQFDAAHSGPQGLVLPFGESIDAMGGYLSNLKTIDDVDVKEWIRKAENAEKEFEIKPDDDRNDANRKESLQRWYSMQRYMLEKKYLTLDMEILTDASRMTEYAQQILDGKGQTHFDNVPLPEEPENAAILTATDFEAAIFN